MAEILAASLPDYLSGLARRRWQPGVLDCAILMADWVVARGLADPIADVRGTYSSERQFTRIVRREGGLIAACCARLAAIGLNETRTPAAGDLMVVLAPYAVRRGNIQRRPTGAIAVSAEQRAVATRDMGIVISDGNALPVIRAWTF
jgi:hypothetical protein